MAENQQPTKDQLLTALEKAHLSGDTQGAKELAAWHNELYGPKPEPEQPGLIDRAKSFFTSDEQPEVDGFTGAMQKAPPEYDSFMTATGKAVRNVPERFQQSAAGLIQMLGEDMGQERERHIAIVSNRLGITPGDYKLLAWAGNEGLVDPKTPIPEALDYIKRNVTGSLNEQQLKQVADMGIINPDEIAGFAKYWREETQKTMEPVNAEPGSAAYYGSAAIGSVAEMGPALLGSILTRNPSVGMRLMAGQVGGQSYAEGREQGLSPDEAQFYAVANAAAEAIPEYIPLSVIMKPGQNFFKRVLKGALAESAQEVLTEAIQTGLDQQMINPDMTWAEARQRLIDAGIIGGLAGPMMSGVAHPVVKAQEKIDQALNAPERQLGIALNQQVEATQFAPAEQAAAQAFDPANAQQQQQPVQRKSMAELVAEKLEQRGVKPAPVVDYAPKQQAMPENVDVPLEVPTQEVVVEEQAKEQVKDEPKQEAPTEEQAQDEAQPTDAAPVYGEGVERVQHTTKRGKELTGVIDREMTLDQAKEIDPYAFKKDGGVFIRDNRIQEYNQKRSEENARVDTAGVERQGDQQQRSQEPGRVPEPAQQQQQQPSDIASEPGKRGSENIPVADTAQRIDDALTPKAEWRNDLMKARDYANKLRQAGKLDGDAARQVWNDAEALTNLIDYATLTPEQRQVRRDIEGRINNVASEPGAENRQSKGMAAQRVIERSDLPESQKQKLLTDLQAAWQPEQAQEQTNEPTELDQPSQEALAGVPAEQVPGAEETGGAGLSPEASGRADAGRGERIGEPGVSTGRGVPDGQGESPISTSGAERTGRGEQRGTDVPGSIADEKPSDAGRPVSRGDAELIQAEEKAAEEAPAPVGETTQQAVSADNRPAKMFTITPDMGIGEGGQKTKFKNNLEAIKILKSLEAEGRQATPEEQQALARYVGWGGIPQAFYGDAGKVSKGWEKEAAQLKELLTDAEYDAARRSTQDAHYTSQEIVTSIWKAVKDMGFAGGRVLEPSVGTGNFLGMMPAGVRGKSQITGVELDHITGGIASHLYPGANIKTPMGFQDFTMPDGYFDLAIGNPPFGSQKLYDGKRKDLSKFSIHNYFFAKSLDGLKPGGVLAMVVSNRLMDGQSNQAAREYMANRADFLGAVRLPNNAFLKNAGTEVTTDIVFLQKREEGTPRKGPSWKRTESVKDANGIETPLNEYFVKNPDMMLGEWGAYGSMYGPNDPALVAREGQDTGALLREALAKLPKGIMAESKAAPAKEEVKLSTSVDNVKVGSMFMDNGKVMVRQDNELGNVQAEPVEFASDKARQRVEGMIKVRDVFTDLRKAQLTEGVKDAALDALRTRLNREYDAFVKVHGPINSDANKRLFRDDPTWPQIAALEESFDKGITPAMAKKTGEQSRKPSASKAAIFFKRTQSPYKAPTKAATAKDAMAASLSEYGAIDMDYMAKLYNKTPGYIANELGDLVYEVEPGRFETRDQYLSGNVKQKLSQARQLAKVDGKYKRNVQALESVQPEDIEAVDIDVKPGAHWLPREDMKSFVDHVLGNESGNAVYIPTNAKWSIDGVPTEAARSRWGTDRVQVTDIVAAAANQKQIVVRDRIDENTTRVNEAATNAANEKVERLKAEFRRWVWQDDARRSRLTRIYNDTFNTDRLREFDGGHLTFPGKVSDDIIKLRPHQANAVWRIVQSGTTLLDHVVGAGKTFTMIAGAMEMRRMGRAKKPMFVVPNHLVGQWAEDFTKLYPGANVLAATKKDFEKGNRKRLFARIATGDWDAVIVAHSSFGKVEMDKEFQERFINQQIRDIDEAIQNIRAQDGQKSRSIKQIEKQKERLQEKLKKLFDAENKDDNLTFGELGVDALFLDEAHEFKNLGFATSMTRVAGLGNPQGSQKAADLFMKTQFVLEKTGGNNVVFATGTPISNTMAEMYTMQRYLDYQTLQDQGIAHFDAWARMYGEVVTDWELSPSGTYKLNSRFSKFVNIPELMQRYLSFGDVINRDDINRQLAAQGKRLPVPKVKGGKPQNVVVTRSDDQAAYIGEPVTDENGRESYPEGSLVWRAEHLPKKPEKGADNMLKIMSDARKAALDMRMIDPAMYGDYEGSKVNQAADNIKRIYDQWSADKGAQLVFIDLSTPKGAKAKEAARIRDLIEKADNGDERAQDELDKMSPDELSALDGDFSVYDDLRQKLINKGIPEQEIAFIHDANTELQKEELFGKVRSGRIRVLFGSTAKMGAGMNVQDRLVALHHMDAPWRPSDLEQREGRIIRQGNKLYERDPDGFEVEINRYATKQTLDSRMWQTIETKARFIEQVRKGNTKTREIEDVGGEASNAAEMKAASSGNPLILEEMDLRQKIRKLEQLEDEHDREQFRIRDQVRRLKLRIETGKDRMLKFTRDAKQAEKAPKDFAITINSGKYDKHKEAGQALLAAANKMADAGQETKAIGEYAGFKLRLDNISGAEFVITIEGEQEYQVDIPDIAEADPTGLAMRITNTVKRISADAKNEAELIKQAERDIPDLEGQITDWSQADELAKVKARHALVIAELKPKNKEQEEIEQDGTSAMMYNAGADVPMPNWRPTYRQAGVPKRPEGDEFAIGDRTVKLKPEEQPTRREGVRVMVEDVIGPRLYQGKVKGKSKLGFYRKNNSEVRVANYDDVEVMAHEMAHYLDMHYRYNKRFTRAYKDTKYRDEVACLSYTSQKNLKYKEGFAEFVRLWLTNYAEAKAAAPLFTQRFEQVLAEDSTLNKKMVKLQDEMHRWYLQGARAQLRAKSGKELSQSQQIIQYMQSYPLERYRQEVIDKIHAAKVVERTLHGEVRDAALSPFKQFQLINGAESLHEAILKDGTPSLAEDGTFEFNGKGLNQVFWPVSKHGWKRFDLLMDYFKARRANELMKQGRERLFTKQEIEAGLKLGVTYPEFRDVFKEYQEFNKRMLDFYEQMGLIDGKQKQAFADANKNYVPFHRVIERLEDGDQAGTTSIGKRLSGGTQNVRDIAENIVEGLYSNIRAALIARAKQTLYRDIMTSQDGSLFAVKLSPDSKLVKVEQTQMAAKIAEAMADVGLTVSKDGMIMAGDPDAQITDVDDIAQALESNPDLLNFWTFGHKPTTAETYVDSAIIDGKRTWFEVRNPLLVDMLTGMRGFKSGALLNAMFRVKNLQTRTVTSMLQFLGPNAVRDTLSAFVISKNKFIPVWDTLIGMGHAIFHTKLYREFRLHGGGYGTRIEARTEETRKRRQLDLPSRNMWDTAAKFLAGYDRFASAFEYGSRLGDYRRGRQAGKNALEAAWEAREVATDFSKMGRNELWAKFLRTVPFMNAGIQGLDKTAREIFELRGEMKGSNLAKLDDAKVRFLAAGGALTLMTVILWLLNEDDDRYQALTPDQKARFWWIFLPGAEKPLKIPRPYDIGHLFATIPEVSLDYIKDRDGKEAAQTLAWTFANTLGVGDYPGIFQPMIEVARNKKFTGAPIVPERLMHVPNEYQFTDRTPQLYRNLGEALGVSPLVAEHYMKGYLRYVEAYISDGSEALLWNEKEWGARPFVKEPIDYLTYQFQGQRVPYRTKWTEGYFELKKKAAGAKSAFDLLTAQAIRDQQPMKDFSADKVNQLLISMDNAFRQIDGAFKDQETVLAAIKYNPDLTRDEKERRIENWYQQKNNALAQFYEQANKALEQVESALSQ